MPRSIYTLTTTICYEINGDITIHKDQYLISDDERIPIIIPVGGEFHKGGVRISKSIELCTLPKSRDRAIVERLYYHSPSDGLLPFKVRYWQSERRGSAFVVPMAITHAHNNFTNFTYFDPRIIAINAVLSSPSPHPQRKIFQDILDKAYIGSPGSDYLVVPDRSMTSVLNSFYRMVADIQDRPCHADWSEMHFDEFVSKHLHHRPPVDDLVVRRYQSQGGLSRRSLTGGYGASQPPFSLERTRPLRPMGMGVIVYSPVMFTPAAWAIERACLCDFEIVFSIEEGVRYPSNVRVSIEDVRSLRDPYGYYFSPEEDHTLSRLSELSAVARVVAQVIATDRKNKSPTLPGLDGALTITVRKSIFEDAVITIASDRVGQCMYEVHLDIALMSLCSLSVGPDVDFY